MNPKDFDGWILLKKKLNDRQVNFYPMEREIWWCSLGVNVGSEQDGKNSRFERPVLVITVFNGQMARVAPMTSNIKDDANHIPVKFGNKECSVIVSHTLTVSTKRLNETHYRLDSEQFKKVVERLKANI